MTGRGAPRVVHVVETLIGGGAESVVRLLCKGLPDEGIRTRAISVYASGLRGSQALGAHVDVIDLARDGRRDLSFFPRLVAALHHMQPDIVHAHLHTGQYAGRLAAVLARVPHIVFTVHGHEPGGILRALADRLLHPRTARFVVFTEAQRLRYARASGVPLDRIVAIANGVALPAPCGDRRQLREALGLPPDAFAVYAMARLSEQKNHLGLLEGFARARAANDDLFLVLAGDGPLAPVLRERAASLGIWEAIRFLGFREDAAGLLGAMDLFALPSFWEGMPLALGEAMLGGVPPVVTPWRDHDAFVADGVTGFVSKGFDGVAIGTALLRARRDEVERRRVATGARRSARALFDPAAMVRAHAELYRSLVAGR